MKKISIQSENNISLDTAFETFITLKNINNLSKETINYYENCFKDFSKFYDTSLPCETVLKETILMYTSYLKKKGIKDVTVNTYLRGMRTILYYFMDVGYMKLFKIQMIKCDKEIKETYTNEELELLLKKPNLKACNFAEYRNWVIINYLIGTGNRLGTVINLKWQDIDYNNGLIKLAKVKNRKQQLIPLSSTLKVILKEYQIYRKGTDEDYVFCNSFGKQMTKSGIETAIKLYNRSRGVNKRSVHLFRHTFAKMWILNGGDIFRLQKILGHSSMDIVKEYVNMFSSDLQQGFDTFSPLDNISETSKQKIHMPNKK